MTDFSDFFGDLFPNFNSKLMETKEEIIDKYIKGTIDKKEFIKRMDAVTNYGGKKCY